MTDTPTPTVKIVSRWDAGHILYEAAPPADLAEATQAVLLGWAVRDAVKNGASLDGASLDGASLDGARLDRARLDRACLVGARLVGASLVGASLVGASLVGARLFDASLDDANLDDARFVAARLDGARLVGARLVGARLDCAILVGAILDGASLDGASLVDASLNGASLIGASLVGARLFDASLDGASLDGACLVGFDIPVLEKIDAAILEAVEKDGNKLDMKKWHVCQTTHCRAGWAIHLCGDAGYALEKAVGSSAAGALIYAKSRPDKPIPNFTASDEDALADMRACAAEAAK